MLTCVASGAFASAQTGYISVACDAPSNKSVTSCDAAETIVAVEVTPYCPSMRLYASTSRSPAGERRYSLSFRQWESLSEPTTGHSC